MSSNVHYKLAISGGTATGKIGGFLNGCYGGPASVEQKHTGCVLAAENVCLIEFHFSRHVNLKECDSPHPHGSQASPRTQTLEDAEVKRATSSLWRIASPRRALRLLRGNYSFNEPPLSTAHALILSTTCIPWIYAHLHGALALDRSTCCTTGRIYTLPNGASNAEPPNTPCGHPRLAHYILYVVRRQSISSEEPSNASRT
ncbi:hypothetical protein BDZ97DRAFT_2000809 [Flammula alnicola]|nr:hypothetical protein BDZ97DRAFT_2000809 [Flammula alnicola]